MDEFRLTDMVECRFLHFSAGCNRPINYPDPLYTLPKIIIFRAPSAHVRVFAIQSAQYCTVHETRSQRFFYVVL